WIGLLVLFALNWYVGSRVPEGKTRLDVPYTFFRAEVTQGNVKEISTRGDTIQGDFRKQVRYPPGKKGKRAARFQTVRPSFGNDGLLNLLVEKGVVVNAHPVDEPRSLLATLL